MKFNAGIQVMLLDVVSKALVAGNPLMTQDQAFAQAKRIVDALGAHPELRVARTRAVKNTTEDTNHG